ncbi:MAG: hypothetical protein OEW75_17715, partial [Cyclobacteriaceae bacterium]|nr:hypothetical protein [Cyclobacteriaceae bacterium]
MKLKTIHQIGLLLISTFYFTHASKGFDKKYDNKYPEHSAVNWKSTFHFPQNLTTTLYAEYDKNTIKLAFLPDFWPQGLNSYYIRQKINGEWLNLHSEKISPRIEYKSSIKTLSDPEFRNKRNKIEAKRDSLIDLGQLKEIRSEVLITALSDPTQAMAIQMFLSRDFDLLLASGLGFQFNLDPKSTEIALFNSDTAYPQPLASLVLKDVLPVEYSLPITSSIKRTGKNIEVKWQVPVAEYDRWKVLIGFNIYRKEEGVLDKINSVPIWMNRSDSLGFLYHKEKLKTDSLEVEYSIRPVSLFNSEGKSTKIISTPSTEKSGKVIYDISIENHPDTGFPSLKWSTDKPSEMLTIETKEGSAKPWLELISINASAKEFHDIPLYSSKPAPEAVLYRFRYYKNNEVEYSPTLSYIKENSAIPPPRLKQPTLENSGSNYHVNLSWEFPQSVSWLRGFQIHTSSTTDTLFFSESSIEILQGNQYAYSIPSNFSDTLKIALTTLSKDGRVSALSNVRKIYIPSMHLPEVIINKTQSAVDQLILQWDYPDLPDIEGFHIYKNNVLIYTANENERQAILKKTDK